MAQRERLHRAAQHRQRPGLCGVLGQLQRKGQRPGHAQKRLHQPGQPRRAGQQQRPGAALGGHRLPQARQAEDMVAVVVGQQHRVDLAGADAPAAGGGLGALAAVDQQAAPPCRDGQAGQGAAGQRLGAAAPQQCDSQHGGDLLSGQKRGKRRGLLVVIG